VIELGHVVTDAHMLSTIDMADAANTADMVGRSLLARLVAIGLAAACLIATAAASETGSAAVAAHIAVKRQGNMRTFIAEAQSASPIHVSYRFHAAVRKGSGGQSVTNQAGDVTLQAGKLVALSRTSLLIGPHDRFCVALTITKDGAVLVRQVVGSDGANSTC
jgi:hypothetical protein